MECALGKKHLKVKLPLSVRGFSDMDYLHKLSPEELEFMRDFSNKYYRAQFNSDENNKAWDSEEKRKSYARKNAGNRDFWTRSVDVGGSLESVLGSDDDSWEED